MSILQQVGARYVTKFYTNTEDGTPRWESGVSYEALVCVSYKYGAFVSKIPVPATVGNPADNSTYWAEFPNPAMGAWEELRVRLENEVSDRENADSDLLEKLNTEIAARQAGDTTLQNNINTVSDNLTQEIADRKAGDQTLQTNINNVNADLTQEIADRKAGDQTLQTNIDTISSNLSAEITNRSNADTALQGNIDNLKTYINNAIADIIAKFYGGGTLATDGNITWGNSGLAAVGNMNILGNESGSKYISTHDGTAEDDVRVN